MKKLLIIVFFSFLSFLSFCQNQDNAKFTKLIQLEVEHYTDSIPTPSGASYFWGSNYKGELSKGIAQLYNLPVTRVKLSRQFPTHYIGYNIFSQNNLKQLEELALASIANVCDFTINDIKDTCQVWQIVVRDSTKLNPFSWQIDRPDGTTWHYPINGGKDIEMFGQTFTALAYWLEVDSGKYIFETDSDDTMDEPNRFKFTVPLEYIRNIEKLRQFMFEKYGIDLVPKMSVVKKKYVEFNKGD
jgi:hypothetical protein